MKQFGLFLILSCFLVGCVSGPQAAPRVADPAEAVRQEVLTIMAIAGRGDWQALAPHLLYTGPNLARNTREAFRWDNPEDRAAVISIGERLHRMGAGGPIRFVEFTTETETEGTWHAWKVTYRAGDADKTAYFAFLPFDGTYLLGDID